MAWGSTPVRSTAQALGQNGGTSTGIDTTGADSLYLMVGYAGGTPPTISDAKSNTWTNVADTNDGNGHHGALYYAQGATVGSGHTVTATATGANIGIAFSAWAGGAATGLLDGSNFTSHSANFTATVQAGSVTPSANNYLLISGFAWTDNGSDESSISSPFTVDTHVAAGAFNFGSALAYEVQGTATARNPTWTASQSELTVSTVLSSFKVGSGVVANTTRFFNFFPY